MSCVEPVSIIPVWETVSVSVGVNGLDLCIVDISVVKIGVVVIAKVEEEPEKLGVGPDGVSKLVASVCVGEVTADEDFGKVGVNGDVIMLVVISLTVEPVPGYGVERLGDVGTVLEVIETVD